MLDNENIREKLIPHIYIDPCSDGCVCGDCNYYHTYSGLTYFDNNPREISYEAIKTYYQNNDILEEFNNHNYEEFELEYLGTEETARGKLSERCPNNGMGQPTAEGELSVGERIFNGMPIYDDIDLLDHTTHEKVVLN